MQELSNETTLNQFVEAAVLKMQNDVEKQNQDWIANFFAEAIVVGCGAAEYKTKGTNIEGIPIKQTDRIYHVYVIRCVLNTVAENRYAYETGEPCSKCPTNEKCDSVYGALCS